MTTVILDYGSGNLCSAHNAFRRVAAEMGRAEEIVVTADPDLVARADRVVLPGVGAFADCARGLEAAGLREPMQRRVIGEGAPFLGVCVGMQLMADVGLEHGGWPGFGWIPGEVVLITPEQPPSGPRPKVPHIGWNELTPADHPLFEGVKPGDHAYFVHSFHLRPTSDAHVLAAADHGGPIVAAVGRDNLAGVQFHPEKSQATGLRVIANFLRWRP